MMFLLNILWLFPLLLYMQFKDNTLENTINVDQSALRAQKTHITLIHMNSTDTPSTERAKSRTEEVCDN